MGYLLQIAKKTHTPEAPVKDGELALLAPGEVVSLEPESANSLIKNGKLRLVQLEPADIEEYCNQCSEALKRINTYYYPRVYGWIDWLKNHKPICGKKLKLLKKIWKAPLTGE